MDVLKLAHSKLGPLFASATTRRFAVALLIIFSPVYVYEIIRDSYGLSIKYSIVIALLYFLLLTAFRVITHLYSENLSQRIGFKKTIWASSIPFVLFVILLHFSKYQPLLLFPTAILGGAQSALFWWGFHGYFIKVGRGHFGVKMGGEMFLETLANVSAPIIGALVVSIFGFTYLFVLVTVSFVTSLLFLIPAEDISQEHDIVPSDVIKSMLKRKKITLAYIGNGGEYVYQYFYWPLFLFLTFGGILTLGGIVSTAALLAGVFLILVGRFVDLKGERKVVAVGTPIISITWLIKLFGRAAPIFVFADAIWQFGEGMVWMPLNILTYEKALEGGSGKAILFREFAIHAGFIASTLLLMIWILAGGSLSGGFIIAFLFSLLPLIAIISGSIHERKTS
jgi:MFS family permease